MLLLDTNTTQNNQGICRFIVSLATDIALFVFGKIEEDSSVKHAVLIKVEQLGSAGGSGLCFFLSCFVVFVFLLTSLFQLLFPGLLHFFELSLIALHLLLRSLEFGSHLGVVATATAATSELLSKFPVFLLKFANNLVLGRLINDGLVLDLLCSVSPHKGVVGFIVVGEAGTNSAHHDGRGVTTETFLEHAGQVRVTVWNKSLFASLCVLSESLNNITERSQRLIDSITFFQTVTGGAGLIRLFRASQIDQVDVRLHGKWGLAGLGVLGDFLEGNRDDGVGARRGCIHLGATHRAVLVASVHVCLDLFVVLDSLGSSVGDRNLTGNLSNLEVFLALLR
jgi:hypothetical protein